MSTPSVDDVPPTLFPTLPPYCVLCQSFVDYVGNLIEMPVQREITAEEWIQASYSVTPEMSAINEHILGVHSDFFKPKEELNEDTV